MQIDNILSTSKNNEDLEELKTHLPSSVSEFIAPNENCK